MWFRENSLSSISRWLLGQRKAEVSGKGGNMYETYVLQVRGKLLPTFIYPQKSTVNVKINLDLELQDLLTQHEDRQQMETIKFSSAECGLDW